MNIAKREIFSVKAMFHIFYLPFTKFDKKGHFYEQLITKKQPG